MHLSLLSSPPPPEPFLHTQEQEGSLQTGQGGKEYTSESQRTGEAPRDDEAKNVSEASDTESSSAHDNEDNDETDSDMDKLLREASEGESSSEDGGGEQDEPSRPREISRKRVARWRRDDSPAATICALIHSCWLLRIPIIYRDIIRYVLPLPSIFMLSRPPMCVYTVQSHRNIHPAIPGANTVIPTVINETSDETRKKSTFAACELLLTGLRIVLTKVSAKTCESSKQTHIFRMILR